MHPRAGSTVAGLSCARTHQRTLWARPMLSPGLPLAPMIRLLISLFDHAQRAFDSPRHRRFLSSALAATFVLSVAAIELARVGVLGERLAAALPRSHFHAVELAFYLLLAYEVTSLTFAIVGSVANAAGKQFEIFSLILLRRSFEAFAGLDEPLRWAQAREAVWHMLSDAVGGLLLFVGLGFYYSLQKHRPLSPDRKDREHFIDAKKLISLGLLLTLIGLGARSLFGLVTEWSPRPFFEPFYTVLIFADVLVVLISIRYSASYHTVFRNSGFAVATVLLRLALPAPPPFTSLLGLAAIVFAIGLTVASDRFSPVLATPAAAPPGDGPPSGP